MHIYIMLISVDLNKLRHISSSSVLRQ